MFTAVTVPLLMREHAPDETNGTSSVVILDVTSRTFYEISSVVILTLIPLLVGVLFYTRIARIVVQSMRLMEGILTQRNVSPARMIVKSVGILLSVTVATWVGYAIARITTLFVSVDKLVFVYWKALSVIAHPFGNGLLAKFVKKSNQVQPSWIGERTIRPDQNPSVSPCIPSDIMMSSNLFLPQIIEKTESTLQISKTELREKSTTLIPAEGATRVRRPSVIHARPSVLIRNAGQIGLEMRDNGLLPNIHKSRKISTDMLRRKLRDIERIDNTLQNSPRRLSQSLRLGPLDDSDDEVYEQYKRMYAINSGGDSDGSVYSSKNFNKAGSADARTRKSSNDSNGSFGSPSSRRWKRLFTTAKTARRWSRHCQQRNAIQEEPDTSQSFNTRSNISPKDAAIMNCMNKNPPLGYLELQRGSMDAVSPARKPRSIQRQRSISCVQNVWLENQHKKQDRGPLKSESIVPESGPKDGRTKPARQSDGTCQPHVTRGRRSRTHWLLDESTTRTECIQKLMEMKDLF